MWQTCVAALFSVILRCGLWPAGPVPLGGFFLLAGAGWGGGIPCPGSAPAPDTWHVILSGLGRGGGGGGGMGGHVGGSFFAASAFAHGRGLANFVAGCWGAHPKQPQGHKTQKGTTKKDWWWWRRRRRGNVKTGAKREQKGGSTALAVRVSSPTTLLVKAHTCLTSLIGREAVFPGGYDRRHNKSPAVPLYLAPGRPLPFFFLLLFPRPTTSAKKKKRAKNEQRCSWTVGDARPGCACAR